jgi:hypothetical protein
MGAIIVEGVLFVALVATGGAFLFWLLITFTPAGVRLRQTRNRKRIERMATLACPIHGLRPENSLVRLANGERMCPDCYKEMFHG